MTLSGEKDGKLTDTRGGGTDGDEPERMETVGEPTSITNWLEEVVRFKAGVLEQFVKRHDKEQRSEYSMNDIMHIIRNLVIERNLHEATNSHCIIFDAEFRSVLGMRSSYGEEYKEKVKEMTTPTGRMVTRGERVLFSGKLEMRPISLGELLYGEQEMAREMKCRVSTAMLNLLATIPRAGCIEKTEWKQRVLSGVLTYGEVCDGVSAHILNNRSTLLEEDNPKMCLCEGDLLQDLFKVRCFHRSQVNVLIKKHLEPIGMSRPAVQETTGKVIETIVKQKVEQVSRETARSTEPLDDTWLIVNDGMEKLGIAENNQGVTRKREGDFNEKTECKHLRKEPLWKNYNPHPRVACMDDVDPFLDDEVYSYGGDIRALNRLLVDHLRRVLDVVWQTGEDVTFWTDCPQVRLINRDDVRVHWTTRRYVAEVPEPMAYLVMDSAVTGKERFLLDKYVQERTFEIHHNGYALVERLAKFGFEIAIRNWDNWRDGCLVMVMKRVEEYEVGENLRKFLKISKEDWISKVDTC